MSEPSSVASALSRIEAAFAGLAKTVGTPDLAQRRRLIEHRRDLAACFVELDRTVELALSRAGGAQELASEYHLRFSTLRRAISMHQTEWPTVLIAEDLAGYIAASQTLRRKRETFLAWLKDTLLPQIGG